MALPHRLTRSLVTVGALTGLGAAFVAGTSYGGGGGAAGPDPWSVPRVRRLARPRSPAATSRSPTPAPDLLDWYVERGVDRVGPYGWGSGYAYPVTDGRRRGRTAAARPTQQRGLARRATARPAPPAPLRCGRPTARPAPTSRRPASTSRTRSRPTGAPSTASRTATWSPTTSPAPRWSGSARSDLPGHDREHRDPAVRRDRGRDLPPGRRRGRGPGVHRRGHLRRLRPGAAHGHPLGGVRHRPGHRPPARRRGPRGPAGRAARPRLRPAR